MNSFKGYYRGIYKTLGFPLQRESAISASLLKETEQRLGTKIPAALREYYLIAGRERLFNQSDNRFLLPDKWKIDQSRLVFLEDSQRACFWGVSLCKPYKEDPPVWHAINDEPINWLASVSRNCSTFLGFMLHHHAASCLPFTSMAKAPSGSHKKLLSEGWTYFGNVHKEKAYSKLNRVACIGPGIFGQSMVMAGAKTEKELMEIADNLEVKFH